MAEKKQTFEQSMARLEEIVTQMERGDVPLEEALRFATAASRMAISHQATIHPGISARADREIVEREDLRCEEL